LPAQAAVESYARVKETVTILAAEQIDAAMEASPSQQKILILDCSYIGLVRARRTSRADPAAHSLDSHVEPLPF
jgi:hypothetical protein